MCAGAEKEKEEKEKQERHMEGTGSKIYFSLLCEDEKLFVYKPEGVSNID